MILTHTQQGRRAAFTLVELLVVIGLMAVLATISVAGYSAASRGMADRGVIQTTVSILRVAQQTCQIDRVPTKVMFFNQKLDTGQEDEADLFQGTAIAIKQAGRITMKPSSVDHMLVDEFADWNQSYPAIKKGETSNAPGIRFFRMADGDKGGDIDSCSVLVQPAVTYYELKDYMIQTGTTIDKWCIDHRRTANDNHSLNALSTTVDSGNNYVWGFKASTSGSGGGLGVDSWKVGDPYGTEIARIDLPKGYIFGSSAPSGTKLVSASVKAVYFDAEDLNPSPSASVPVSAIRPAAGGTFAVKTVGTVTKSMLDDK